MMDRDFFRCWFRGFQNALRKMEDEERRRMLAHCARQCAGTGVLQSHLCHYEAVKGDRDEFYRRLSEIGNVRGEIVIPGKEYIVCFPDCARDLHTECAVDTPLLCECSTQSILYVAENVWKECDIRVESEGTILSGAPECRFRLIFQ